MPEPMLTAPFPWFGGKRRVADVVWRAFGSPPNYVEPFFGSGAVLLARPGGAGKIETVNDIDRFVANFWRATVHDPEAVAHYASWPVNEADLHARHLWLVNQEEFRQRMHTDPDYFDAKIAGWWVWGLCAWIGGNWCKEPHNHKHPKLDGIGKGVHSLRGQQLPDNRDKGVHRRAYSGQGVHLPSLGNDRGINGVVAAPLIEWFGRLRDRLRRVRVACGDWKRVLGASTLGKGKNVGGRRPCAVFLDPPYPKDERCAQLYTEDHDVAYEAAAWAIDHGDDPDLRIAFCGYAGAHEFPPSWTEYAWKAARGYAGKTNGNRERERIWFSPHCLPLNAQRSLFEMEVAHA